MPFTLLYRTGFICRGERFSQGLGARQNSDYGGAPKQVLMPNARRRAEKAGALDELFIRRFDGERKRGLSAKML